jgi:hypothetical protein
VCGSDGITYLNICHLDAHNECRGTRIEKAHDGECPPHEHCVPDHNPIMCHCNDGHVVCRPRIRCNNVFKPVCGTDGRTYQNACQLAVANACFSCYSFSVVYWFNCYEIVYHYMSLSMFGCFLEEQHRNNLLTNHAVFSN